MRKITVLLLLLTCAFASYSQTFPNNTTQGNAGTLTTFPGAVQSHFKIRQYADTATANTQPYLRFTPGLLIKVGEVIYVRNSAATQWILINSSGGGGVVPGGPITTIPELGDIPGVSVAPEVWIQNAFYGTQAPTANLTGGEAVELSSESILPYTLNWFASRQTATATLATIVVAGTNQSFSQPAQPGTVSGTQNVSVPANTTTTYSNVVTTTDGKTATANTTFNFFPKRYWFYSSTSTPSSADVVAALGGNSELTTTKVKSTQFAVAVSGADKYVSYAYPSSYGALTSIIVSGIESIGAFNLNVVSVTNASGYTQNYNVYTTDNVFNNVTITFISVQ